MNDSAKVRKNCWFRLITFIVITTLLCHDIAWAGAGNSSQSKLSPGHVDVERLRNDALDEFLGNERTWPYVFRHGRLPTPPMGLANVLDGFLEVTGKPVIEGDTARIEVKIDSKPAILCFSRKPLADGRRYWFETPAFLKAPGSRDLGPATIRYIETLLSLLSLNKKTFLVEGIMIDKAVEEIRSRVPKEENGRQDITPGMFRVNVVDLDDKLGIPRHAEARMARDFIYAYSRKGEDGRLDIYITKRLWEREILRKDGNGTLSLAEVIDHEWQEKYLNRPHSSIAGRARYFCEDSDAISCFHRFYLTEIRRNDGKEGIDFLISLLEERRDPKDTSINAYEKRFRRFIRDLLENPIAVKLEPNEEYRLSYSNIGPFIIQLGEVRFLLSRHHKSGLYNLAEYSPEGSDDSGYTFEEYDMFILGRGFFNNPTISKRHLSVKIEGDTITLKDLGSSHGTIISLPVLVPQEIPDSVPDYVKEAVTSETKGKERIFAVQNLNQPELQVYYERALRKNITLIICREFQNAQQSKRQRLLRYLDILLEAIEELPSGLVDKARSPLVLKVGKIVDKETLGQAQVRNTRGFAKLPMTQFARVGVKPKPEILVEDTGFEVDSTFDKRRIAKTLAHEIIGHKLSTVWNRKGNVIMPRKDWIDVAKINGVESLCLIGNEQMIPIDELPTGEWWFLQAIRRINCLAHEYYEVLHELVAYSVVNDDLREGDRTPRHRLEETRKVLRRNLLREEEPIDKKKRIYRGHEFNGREWVEYYIQNIGTNEEPKWVELTKDPGEVKRWIGSVTGTFRRINPFVPEELGIIIPQRLYKILRQYPELLQNISLVLSELPFRNVDEKRKFLKIIRHNLEQLLAYNQLSDGTCADIDAEERIKGFSSPDSEETTGIRRVIFRVAHDSKNETTIEHAEYPDGTYPLLINISIELLGLFKDITKLETLRDIYSKTQGMGKKLGLWTPFLASVSLALALIVPKMHLYPQGYSYLQVILWRNILSIIILTLTLVLPRYIIMAWRQLRKEGKEITLKTIFSTVASNIRKEIERDWRLFTYVGIMLRGFAAICTFAALVYTSAFNVSLFMASTIVVVLLIDTFVNLGRRFSVSNSLLNILTNYRPDRPKLHQFAFTMLTGLGVYIALGGLSIEFTIGSAGLIILLLQSVLWGISINYQNNYNKKLSQKGETFDPINIANYSLIIGTICFIIYGVLASIVSPLFIGTAAHSLFNNLSLDSILTPIADYLGLGLTSITMLIYYLFSHTAPKYTKPASFFIMISAYPLFVALFSWMFYGAGIYSYQIIGAIIVVAGISLFNYWSKGRKEKTEGQPRSQRGPEQCVTGDTILPLLVSRYSSLVYVPTRIVDVAPGDYVLSLNEETQQIEPHRINGLLDMGIKPVYRLTTASGRSIKTTANHPYLTKNGWVKVSGLSTGDKIGIPSYNLSMPVGIPSGINTINDNTVHFNIKTDAIFADSEPMGSRGNVYQWFGKMQWVVRFTEKLKFFCNAFLNLRLEFFKFAFTMVIKLNLINHLWNQLKPNSRLIFSNGTNPNLFASSIPFFNLIINFGLSGKCSSMASISQPTGLWYTYSLLEADSSNFASNAHSRSHNEYVSNIKYLAVPLLSTKTAALKSLGKASPFVLSSSGSSANLCNSFNLTGSFADNFTKDVDFIPSPPISYKYSTIKQRLSRLFLAAEVEAAQIGSDIQWDRIISIEYLGYEHVYDIEVEGTHNFIGNGIFAHNTYVPGSGSDGGGRWIWLRDLLARYSLPSWLRYNKKKEKIEIPKEEEQTEVFPNSLEGPLREKLLPWKDEISNFSPEQQEIFQRALRIRGKRIAFDIEASIRIEVDDFGAGDMELIRRLGDMVYTPWARPLIIGLFANNELMIITGATRDLMQELLEKESGFLDKLIKEGKVPFYGREDIRDRLRENTEFFNAMYEASSDETEEEFLGRCTKMKLPELFGFDFLIDDMDLFEMTGERLSEGLNHTRFLFHRYGRSLIPNWLIRVPYYVYNRKRDATYFVGLGDAKDSEVIKRAVQPIFEKLEGIQTQRVIMQILWDVKKEDSETVSIRGVMPMVQWPEDASKMSREDILLKMKRTALGVIQNWLELLGGELRPGDAAEVLIPDPEGNGYLVRVTIGDIVDGIKRFYKAHPMLPGEGLSEREKGIFLPADIDDLVSIFAALGIPAGLSFIDLGSGDGRVTAMAGIYNLLATGIEYEKDLFRLSLDMNKILSRFIGKDRLRFINGDFMDRDLSKYDVVCYSAAGTSKEKGLKEKIMRELRDDAVFIIFTGGYEYSFTGWSRLRIDNTMVFSRSDNNPLFVKLRNNAKAYMLLREYISLEWGMCVKAEVDGEEVFHMSGEIAEDTFKIETIRQDENHPRLKEAQVKVMLKLMLLVRRKVRFIQGTGELAELYSTYFNGVTLEEKDGRVNYKIDITANRDLLDAISYSLESIAWDRLKNILRPNTGGTAIIPYFQKKFGRFGETKRYKFIVGPIIEEVIFRGIPLVIGAFAFTISPILGEVLLAVWGLVLYKWFVNMHEEGKRTPGKIVGVVGVLFIALPFFFTQLPWWIIFGAIIFHSAFNIFQTIRGKITGKEYDLAIIKGKQIDHGEIKWEKESTENRLEIIGENEGVVTRVHKARYKGETYWAKFAEDEEGEEILVIPQAEIIKYLNGLNIPGVCVAEHFIELENGQRAILFRKFPPGGLLEKRKDKLSEEERIDIMLKILYVVRDLHRAGVHHWDLKLENIWLTDTGEVILFDFDFAFRTGRKDEFRKRGLQATMSPSYASEKRASWLKGDYPKNENEFPHTPEELYSLGMVLLNLIADSEVPIIGKEETSSTYANKLLGRFWKKQRIPGRLRQILIEAIWDGRCSYQNINDFIRDFKKFRYRYKLAKKAERLWFPGIEEKRRLVKEIESLGVKINGWRRAPAEYLEDMLQILRSLKEEDRKHVTTIRLTPWYRSLLFWFGYVDHKEKVVIMPTRSSFRWVFVRKLGEIIMEQNKAVVDSIANNSWADRWFIDYKKPWRLLGFYSVLGRSEDVAEGFAASMLFPSLKDTRFGEKYGFLTWHLTQVKLDEGGRRFSLKSFLFFSLFIHLMIITAFAAPKLFLVFMGIFAYVALIILLNEPVFLYLFSDYGKWIDRAANRLSEDVRRVFRFGTYFISRALYELPRILIVAVLILTIAMPTRIMDSLLGDEKAKGEPAEEHAVELIDLPGKPALPDIKEREGIVSEQPEKKKGDEVTGEPTTKELLGSTPGNIPKGGKIIRWRGNYFYFDDDSNILAHYWDEVADNISIRFEGYRAVHSLIFVRNLWYPLNIEPFKELIIHIKDTEPGNVYIQIHAAGRAVGGIRYETVLKFAMNGGSQDIHIPTSIIKSRRIEAITFMLSPPRGKLYEETPFHRPLNIESLEIVPKEKPPAKKAPGGRWLWLRDLLARYGLPGWLQVPVEQAFIGLGYLLYYSGFHILSWSIIPVFIGLHYVWRKGRVPSTRDILIVSFINLIGFVLATHILPLIMFILSSIAHYFYNRHVEAGENISCGTVCESGHEGSYDALDEQLTRQFKKLRKLLRSARNDELTEEEADKALVLYARSFGIKVTYEQLQEFRRQIKEVEEGLRSIEIFFSIPETGTELWWVGDDYAGGHFNRAGTRMHISLPIILEWGIDAGISIARHELAHIQGNGHQKDKGRGIVKRIAKEEKKTAGNIPEDTVERLAVILGCPTQLAFKICRMILPYLSNKEKLLWNLAEITDLINQKGRRIIRHAYATEDRDFISIVGLNQAVVRFFYINNQLLIQEISPRNRGNIPHEEQDRLISFADSVAKYIMNIVSPKGFSTGDLDAVVPGECQLYGKDRLPRPLYSDEIYVILSRINQILIRMGFFPKEEIDGRDLMYDFGAMGSEMGTPSRIGIEQRVKEHNDLFKALGLEEDEFLVFLARDGLSAFEFLNYLDIFYDVTPRSGLVYQPGLPFFFRHSNYVPDDNLSHVMKITGRIYHEVKRELSIPEQTIPDGGADETRFDETLYQEFSRRFKEKLVPLIESDEIVRKEAEFIYLQLKKIGVLKHKKIRIVDLQATGRTIYYVKSVLEYFAEQEGISFDKVDGFVGYGRGEGVGLPKVRHRIPGTRVRFRDVTWPFAMYSRDYDTGMVTFRAINSRYFVLLHVYQSLLLFNEAVNFFRRTRGLSLSITQRSFSYQPKRKRKEYARHKTILDLTKEEFLKSYYRKGYFRPGHFGKKIDDIYKRLDEWFGKGNWQVCHFIGGKFVPTNKALELYEDAYVEYFRSHPGQLEWLVNMARDVYDNSLTNIQSGTDYNAQETKDHHFHDIAIRRAIKRLGREFKGKKYIQIRGHLSRGYHLNPGIVPFHTPELILQPGLAGWWRPGSIEAFYQSNKIIILNLPEGLEDLPAAKGIEVDADRRVETSV